MIRFVSTLILLALALPGRGAAQDVEMLGRRYGTPLPPGYFRTKSVQPDAFEMGRGWRRRGIDRQNGPQARLDRRGATPALVDGSSASGSGPALLGPRSDPVEGTFRIAVLLGLYANSGSPPPFPRDTIAERYFGSGGQTITDYYDEVSGGRAAVLGDVFDWVRAPKADTIYTQGESGLVSDGIGGGGPGNFIIDLLERLSPVDWAAYDNDGPDGVPNSGDDDGFVDLLAVIQPDRGGECGGPGGDDRIWSHHWAISAAVSPPAQPYTTDVPAANGGFIRIDDYVIEPAVACSGGALSPIGVFTHEIGHGFGLPDLYDTDGGHSGAGTWDLMSSGSYGCDNFTPASPCHMGAWTKTMLGWADVVDVPADTDLGTVAMGPVELGGPVYRIDAADGSGEYFLIENRQRVGFDSQLYGEGLLVWQIDQAVVSAQWFSNRINAALHMGVRIRQADGEDDLDLGRGRGDAGDPFPGSTGNAVFHTASDPSSLTYAGGVSGLTVHDIAPLGGDDVTLGLSTHFTVLTVSAQGAADPSGLLAVDGVEVAAPPGTIVSAPFVSHTLEAAAGEVLGPGARRPFVDWQDDPAAPRVRTVLAPLADTEYRAEFGGTEYQLSLAVTGGVGGVAPGTFTSEPSSSDLWYGEGASVSLLAVPGLSFDFLAWSGALAGQANPASFTMTGPLDAGADFELAYTVVETMVDLPAATNLAVQLEVERGTAPVIWSVSDGTLPVGVTLSRTGVLGGASLDLGSFDLTVVATDASGLSTTGVITLDFTLPAIPLGTAATPFLLSGDPLTGAQLNFLNRQGNGHSGYDVGDFRAWVLGNPDLPLSADFGEGVVRRTVRITEGGEEGRQ